MAGRSLQGGRGRRGAELPPPTRRVPDRRDGSPSPRSAPARHGTAAAGSLLARLSSQRVKDLVRIDRGTVLEAAQTVRDVRRGGEEAARHAGVVERVRDLAQLGGGPPGLRRVQAWSALRSGPQ